MLLDKPIDCAKTLIFPGDLASGQVMQGLLENRSTARTPEACVFTEECKYVDYSRGLKRKNKTDEPSKLVEPKVAV